MPRSIKLISLLVFLIFSFFVLVDIFRAPELLMMTYEDYGAQPGTAISGREKSLAEKEIVTSKEQTAFGQKVIKRGYADIASEDLKKDLDAIKSGAERFGAFVVSEEVAAGDYREAFITFAVPEKNYEDFVSFLRRNFDIVSYSLNSQDVTEEFVDLEAQLKSARDELKAVESLLSKAKDVNEILKIRDRSKEIRLEVARLEQRLKQIEREVSYSFVTVSLRSKAVIRGERNWWSTTLRDAVLIFQRSLRRTILLLVALVPVALSALLIYLVFSALRRLFFK